MKDVALSLKQVNVCITERKKKQLCLSILSQYHSLDLGTNLLRYEVCQDVLECPSFD